MLYNPPSGATDPNAPYVGKNVAAGIQGSRVPKSAIEHPMREIVNFITKSGFVPSASDLFQLAKSVQSGKVIYGVAAGTNALSVTLDPAVTGAPPDGMHLLIWCPNPNTGPMTLSLNGGAPIDILRRDSVALVAGDVPSDGAFLFVAKRGQAWRSLAPLPSEFRSTIVDYSPQRLAFDQYFSDTNPLMLGNSHYDTDGDMNTMPAAARKTYEYVYQSAFPDEKTIVNVAIIQNLGVTRPGNSTTFAVVRGRVLNAASVNRNNYIIIDDNMGTAIPINWKSIAFSVVAAKEEGTTSLTLQTYSWWRDQISAVAGNPYQVFFDDCEMLIIERVVPTLPTYGHAD